MRKILVSGAILAIGITLAGCGGDYEDRDHNLVVKDIVVHGETVTCVVYDDTDYSQGGLSCDFGNAR